MWCEGKEPGQITKALHSSHRTIKQDIVQAGHRPSRTSSQWRGTRSRQSQRIFAQAMTPVYTVYRLTRLVNN